MTPAVTPQPTPQQQPGQGDAVPMQFKDGSQSMVPKEKVVDAMYDGGEFLHPMRFPDGSQAMVVHSRLAGAFKDGGQRLDTQPVKAATWKDYVSGIWGGLTQGPVSQESLGVGQDAGQQMHEGLDEAGIPGKRLSGAVKIAGTVADAASPLLGAAGGEAVPLEETAAKEETRVYLKTLMSIAKQTWADTESSSAKISSAGWKEFADAAYTGGAQARATGNSIKAMAFDKAALAAKGYSKYEGLKSAIIAKYPKTSLAVAGFLAYEALKATYNKLTGTDEENARRTLFGDD